ncbi:MAG: glycosyltransferase family 2 protein [Actinomycetota bacterium]
MQVQEIEPVIDVDDLRQPPPFCVVVIPAHNEEQSLPSVLGAIPRSASGIPLAPLVVADGCEDRTEEVARERGVAVLTQQPRLGSGAAVRLGFRAALEAGATIVVTLDGDGQHDPAEIERLLAPLLEGRADIVQGSRALGGFEVGAPLRRFGIRFFARVMSRLVGVPVTDPSTGFRAATAAALTQIDIRQNQFYVPEFIVETTRRGLRLLEVPATGRARLAGKSKKPHSLRYAWGFTKTLVHSHWR